MTNLLISLIFSLSLSLFEFKVSLIFCFFCVNVYQSSAAFYQLNSITLDIP